MSVGTAVAKQPKSKPSVTPQPEPPTKPPAVEEVPGGTKEDDAEYTEHLLVPLPFMQRLERVAQKVNQRRKQLGQKKRAKGWFVVTHLEDWLSLAEAELGVDQKKEE